MNIKFHFMKYFEKAGLLPPLGETVRKLRIKFLRLVKKDLDYYYDGNFSENEYRDKSWTPDFCRLIMNSFHPSSVIDFGCGIGDFLRPFEKLGLTVLGIDGSKSNKERSKINKDNFIVADLRKGYRCDRKYDLCLCLEVAEHIEEKYSDVLVGTLTASSPTVVFTAALPGKEGVHHVNLKPSGWWIEKFRKKGFRFDERLTERIKAGMRKMKCPHKWYIRNLLIFRQG